MEGLFPLLHPELPSDWTTRSCAGRGSAITGFSSIMLSSWLWWRYGLETGFGRRPSSGRNRLGKTLRHELGAEKTGKLPANML